jgi:hypothetical protein
MTHIPEEKLNGAVRGALEGYHRGATVSGFGYVQVRGDRYADMVVENRRGGRQAILVEVENGVGEYVEAIGQATHYRRAGYVPVMAMPVVVEDLADADTDSGETLNVCAEADVGLLGVFFDRDEAGEPVTGAGYVLRPWGY